LNNCNRILRIYFIYWVTCNYRISSDIGDEIIDNNAARGVHYLCAETIPIFQMLNPD
jgi:hypothetical protein